MIVWVYVIREQLPCALLPADLLNPPLHDLVGGHDFVLDLGDFEPCLLILGLHKGPLLYGSGLLGAVWDHAEHRQSLLVQEIFSQEEVVGIHPNNYPQQGVFFFDAFEDLEHGFRLLKVYLFGFKVG